MRRLRVRLGFWLLEAALVVGGVQVYDAMRTALRLDDQQNHSHRTAATRAADSLRERS